MIPVHSSGPSPSTDPRYFISKTEGFQTDMNHVYLGLRAFMRTPYYVTMTLRPPVHLRTLILFNRCLTFLRWRSTFTGPGTHPDSRLRFSVLFPRWGDAAVGSLGPLSGLGRTSFWVSGTSLVIPEPPLFVWVPGDGGGGTPMKVEEGTSSKEKESQTL